MFLSSVRVRYKVMAVNPYPYYHVSDHSKLPSVKDSDSTSFKFKDPLGVYLFKKGEPIIIGDWSKKKYRWDAALKSGLKLLDLEKISSSVVRGMFQKYGLTIEDVQRALAKRSGEDDDYKDWVDCSAKDFSKRFFNAVDGEGKGQIFYRQLRDVFFDSKKFTEFFKHSGYDGIIDTEGVIFDGEPQTLVFSETDIIWGDREPNKPQKEYGIF